MNLQKVRISYYCSLLRGIKGRSSPIFHKVKYDRMRFHTLDYADVRRRGILESGILFPLARVPAKNVVGGPKNQRDCKGCRGVGKTPS